MGNRKCKLSQSEVEDLLTRCSFSTDRILEMHRHFVREHPSGRINRDAFVRSYEARFPDADPEFSERLFRAHDFDASGDLSFGELVISLNVTINGSAEDKLLWAFRMFDLDGDGTVSYSEIVDILKVLALFFFSQICKSAVKCNTQAR